MPENKLSYDLIILGTGPAGLSASIYASRYKISHITIGTEIGGYLNEIHKIENYPGIENIGGIELAQKMANHAKNLGTEIKQEIVKDIKRNDNFYSVKTSANQYQAKFILYSIGTNARKLEIPGEEKLRGKGVSYCATCDGPFFKNKKVTVVGGGNSAAMAALMLAQHAEKVTLFYRGEKIKCAPVYAQKMEADPKIEIVCCTNLKEVVGEEKVEKIMLDNSYRGSEAFETDGVFVEIGSSPNNQMILSLGVEMNEQGFIKTNPDQSTNLENFYAAGDITTNSNGFRQIVTATAEGAVAVYSVFEKLKN